MAFHLLPEEEDLELGLALGIGTSRGLEPSGCLTLIPRFVLPFLPLLYCFCHLPFPLLDRGDLLARDFPAALPDHSLELGNRLALVGLSGRPVSDPLSYRPAEGIDNLFWPEVSL